MNSIRQKRLKFEFEDMKNYPEFKVTIDQKNGDVWYVEFKGAAKTLYENENFTLKFQFDKQYVIHIII